MPVLALLINVSLINELSINTDPKYYWLFDTYIHFIYDYNFQGTPFYGVITQSSTE